jgi:hypothetical protein
MNKSINSSEPKLTNRSVQSPPGLCEERKVDKQNKYDKIKSADMLKNCRLLVAVMPKVESKQTVPTYKGRDAPSSLADPHPGYSFEETKESLILRDSFRALLGDKHYRLRLSTALNMSSSGAGAVNSTISVSAIQFVSDFVSLSTVFNEFFVVAMKVIWQPVSRYQYPLGGTSTLSVANLPIGKGDLQHGATAYTSLAAMADNFNMSFHNTGDPFTDTWHNTESMKESVVAEVSGATQSWCTTGNAANYSGMLQYLSQSTPPALPFSQVLGTFITYWDVHFRVRV